MKTRRIATSIALAASVALGLTGCGLFAPQATTHVYAPSDGIDVTLENVAVRNLMLIADESGENFNVVFTAINTTDAPVKLRFNFEGKSGKATADFVVEPGTTAFGNPEGDEEPQLVAIKGLAAGDAVTAFIESNGGGDQQREVPVLDGTLAEYKDYVIGGDAKKSDDAAEGEEAAEEAAH